MPVANPPAPDVEAIARRITERLVVEGDVTSFPRLRAAIASALTAHTASLQARVEELERERDILTTGGIIEVAVRNLNVRHYMDHWEGRADKAESEANRMREALERAKRTLFDTYGADRAIARAIDEIGAALRPEPGGNTGRLAGVAPGLATPPSS